MPVPRCGHCRGRGFIRPLNPADDPTCPTCEGSGDKPAYKPKPKPRVEYESKPESCVYADHSPCSGRLTHDHVIRRNSVTNHVLQGRKLDVDSADHLRRILSDPRLLVGACMGHNLLRESSGQPQPQPDDLHRDFWKAIAEYGLEPILPRHLAQDLAA